MQTIINKIQVLPRHIDIQNDIKIIKFYLIYSELL